MMKAYYIQPVSRNTVLGMKIRSVIYSGKTRYQEVEIIDFEDYGVGLVLDGFVQSTQVDEHIYHESLVHPAMILNSRAEDVLIIGGGEGATLREVLKHNTVRKAVMVDIDGELVELAKKFLGFMHQGAFYDPRAEIVIQDGSEYVRKTPDKQFDVIIIDLTDPYEPSGLARKLYSEEFYRDIKRISREDSVIATQAGNAFYYPREYEDIVASLRKIFRYVGEYESWIPSFGYAVSYIIASDTIDPMKFSEEEFDRRLKRRGVSTRYINGVIFRSLILKGVSRRL
ncbi:MAG: spermidine synthase [Sulfolobales archaeon]